MSKKKAQAAMKIICDMFPDAHCELKHENAFELTIAVLLSAQATDKSVNKVTVALFNKYKTPQDYLEAPLSVLENDLRAIGLYKTKSKNIRKLCEILLSDYNGEVPATYDDLVRLPGVGRKTANVVLSVWFKVPRIAVDTHVERISKRLKFARLKDSVLGVEERLMYLLPKDTWSHAHHALIFFGRYHCTARNPKCDECPLYEWCSYKNKSQ
jgi:endonuclease-3